MAAIITNPRAVIELPDISTVRPWSRPSEWVAITTPAANEEKAVILKAVFNGTQEWTALSAAGNYTVDWGDGNVENFASGVTAEHTYNYADADLTDTSATLGYKQAVITITPQAGQSLTSLNLHLQHSAYSATGLGIYESGFLDVRIAGANLTALLFGAQSVSASTQKIGHYLCEKFELLDNSITDFGYLLSGSSRMQSVFLTTDAATKAEGVFANNRLLTTIPWFNTSNCTSLAFLYQYCQSLISVPFLNTSSCLNFASMHSNNFSLPNLHLYDTSQGTNFNAFLTQLKKCTVIPLYNTANGLDFTNFVSGATLVKELPFFDLSKATTLNTAFASLPLLSEIPLYNTALVTDFTSFLNGNTGLLSVPLFNMQSAITLTNAFNSLYNVKDLPLFNLSSCQTFTTALGSARLLRKTEIINAAAGTVFTTLYNGAYNLEHSILSGCRYTVSLAYCKFSKTNLEAFIAALGVAATGTQTLTISGNPGTGTITSLSGTTTAASKTVTFASTTGINVGDRMTGTGSPLTTAIACSFQDTGDTVTINNHQLPLNHPVSFVTIVTTTGIAVRTIYYVSAPAANTFQLAAAPDGAALPLTTNGTGTMIYDAVVETINTNVAVVLSAPATSTSTSSKSFRALNTAPAVLHGFTISG